MNRVNPVSGVRASLHQKHFKIARLAVAIVTAVTVQFADGLVNGKAYPMGPNPQVTPGALCNTPSAYRYPEKIKYCDRNVESRFKNEIIQTYDRQFGYEVQMMQRSQFKIDHYIPLCAGGSNDRENLWPQHQSVYTITDPLEALICEKMAAGRLKQLKAVEIIKTAKNNLNSVPAIINSVRSL